MKIQAPYFAANGDALYAGDRVILAFWHPVHGSSVEEEGLVRYDAAGWHLQVQKEDRVISYELAYYWMAILRRTCGESASHQTGL